MSFLFTVLTRSSILCHGHGLNGTYSILAYLFSITVPLMAEMLIEVFSLLYVEILLRRKSLMR